MLMKVRYTLSMIWRLTCDLWQQLEFVSELEFDLEDTVDWGRKWIFDFNTGKIQLVLFYWSNIAGAKTDAEHG